MSVAGAAAAISSTFAIRAYIGSPSTSTCVSSPVLASALNQARREAFREAPRVSHWSKVSIDAGPNAER
jgi:hypothetical protein